MRLEAHHALLLRRPGPPSRPRPDVKWHPYGGPWPACPRGPRPAGPGSGRGCSAQQADVEVLEAMAQSPVLCPPPPHLYPEGVIRAVVPKFPTTRPRVDIVGVAELTDH